MGQLISFVIPCYRSEKTIRGVVEEVMAAAEALSDDTYEIILIMMVPPMILFRLSRAFVKRIPESRELICQRISGSMRR